MPPDHRPILRLVMLAAGASVLMQGIAVTLSRGGAFEAGLVFHYGAVTVSYAAGVAAVCRRDLPARARRLVVLAIGLVPTGLYRLGDPLMVTAFDEQLHLRTLRDLLNGAPLFSENPLLQASSCYPGLELLTLLVQRVTHLPTIVAITATVLASRALLALALYELAAALTRDRRAASLAVAFYAVSPQFYFFNSQFAYQTLAFSFSLLGFLLLFRAVRGVPRRRQTRAGFALLCFAACVLTHHLTSWITVAVLIAWALLATGQPGRRTLVAIASATTAMAIAWLVPSAIRMGGYLGPLFADALGQALGVATGARQPTAFSDATGTPTPGWHRALLLTHVVICTAASVACGLRLLRRRAAEQRRPLTVAIGLVCLGYPVTFASRLTPKIAEVADRSTTFWFLPVAIGAAVLASAWLRGSPRRQGHRRRRRPPAIPLVLLATLTYLGGTVLGSGADWGRLPGPYLVVADNRSLDPEVLAAARWSRTHLTPGETVMADRNAATHLSAVAGLWPQWQARGVQPATLYFSAEWGAEQTRTAQAMGLRYLYVDTRLAEGPSHRRWYFYTDENPAPRQPTRAELTKFDGVPGVVRVYRHGPISIYDLGGLPVASQRFGWQGRWLPAPWRDAVLGLLLGMAVSGAATAARRTGPLVSVLGIAGGWGVWLAAGTVFMALALLVGASPGWVAALSCLVGFLGLRLASGQLSPRALPPTLARPGAHQRPGTAAGVICLILALGTGGCGVGLAIRAAWATDVTATNHILESVDRVPTR